MPVKSSTVYFFRSSVGPTGASMADHLASAELVDGNLPAVDVGGALYQARDLRRSGQVWTGTFAHLRDDAPHVVGPTGTERPLDLNTGDRLLERCHFIYSMTTDVLVWQSVRGLAGSSTLQTYFTAVFGEATTLPQVMNEEELERVLNGQLYELHFNYARPAELTASAPQWNQHAFAMMESSQAALAKFTMRAPRFGQLSSAVKNWVRRLVREPGFAKVTVKLTDESDPVKLFMAPLKDTIRYRLEGRYPIPTEVFQELGEAYDRKRPLIPVNR